MDFFEKSLCPICLDAGWKDRELEPVFAIAREDLQKLNPLFLSVKELQKILEKSIIVDVAMCNNGHGLINLETGQRMNPTPKPQ